MSVQEAKGTASDAIPQCQSSWVRLKFLPLEWAVDTTVGLDSIAELLRASCGLECHHIDITSGYRHQRGRLGPTYAYAYIKVTHREDAETVVRRMSAQLIQGTRVRATIKAPGHTKVYGQGESVLAGSTGQCARTQAQVKCPDRRWKSDLPCPSGLNKMNLTCGDSETHPHGAWEDDCVWVISSEEEDEQSHPPTGGTTYVQGPRWGLTPQVSKWNDKDRFQAVLMIQDRVILTTYRHGHN